MRVVAVFGGGGAKSLAHAGAWKALLEAGARPSHIVGTSMEVGVKIIAENVLTGEKRHTNSCYVTYVALDDQGVPTAVPPIVPETADEKRRYDRAAKRRASRVMDRRYDIGAGE